MSGKIEEVLNEDLVAMVDECSKLVKDEISRISLRDLSSGKKLMGMLLKQKSADKIRSKNEKRGINYPVAVVVDWQNNSITSNIDLWDKIIGQCKNSGVSVISFSDDSLLLKSEILDLFAKYPEIIFPAMIKSSDLNVDLINYFYNTRNVIPIIKIENFNKGIDLSVLRKNNILFVIYFKVNSVNLQNVLNNKMIEFYYNNGCKAFFFMEEKGKIQQGEINIINETMKFFKEKYKGIFINFPGEKKIYDGCLEENVGFCYISSKCEIIYGEPLDSSNIISSLLNAKLRDVRELQEIYK